MCKYWRHMYNTFCTFGVLTNFFVVCLLRDENKDKNARKIQRQTIKIYKFQQCSMSEAIGIPRKRSQQEFIKAPHPPQPTC